MQSTANYDMQGLIRSSTQQNLLTQAVQENFESYLQKKEIEEEQPSQINNEGALDHSFMSK